MVWHDAVYDNIQSTPIDSNSSIDIMKVPFIINLSQGPGTRSVKVENGDNFCCSNCAIGKK